MLKVPNFANPLLMKVLIPWITPLKTSCTTLFWEENEGSDLWHKYVYLSLPRNCWWRKTWCIARKLQAENRKNVKYLKGAVQWTGTMISSHLESFFTVRFWPECEVVIFGGTEKKCFFSNIIIHEMRGYYSRGYW